MIKTIGDIEDYLAKYSGLNFTGGTTTPEIAIAKLERFHELIANPEDNLNLIHVAGTSGKGSICTILAKSLNSQGFSTGHGLSPHLVNITERFQINSRPIAETKLINYFNQFIEILEDFQSGKTSTLFPPLSYL